MKFDAHPLVVAVALGLLGPGALVGADTDDDCEGCTERREDSTSGAEVWEPGESPSAAEFHRVELEWLKQGA